MEIKREIGDRNGEAKSLGNLGIAFDLLGQYQQAIDFHSQSLEIKREIGDRRGESDSLWNLAQVYQRKGRIRLAMKKRHQAYLIWHSNEASSRCRPISKLREKLC
ncbi:MAG: tetratricopeptide repeat protein [Cyanobacteria bacterium P01_F01_bin.42]